MTIKMHTTLGASVAQAPFTRRAVVNRRAFLRAGAVAVGLPFLEGLPSRSAWAADAPPRRAINSRRPTLIAISPPTISNWIAAADRKLYNGLPGKHLAHFAAPANPEQKLSG